MVECSEVKRTRKPSKIWEKSLDMIQVKDNSEIGTLKFVDDNKNPVKYYLKEIYLIGNKTYPNYVIANDLLNTEVLVDSESLIELHDRGYIDNIIISEDNKIRLHNKSIKANNSKEFKKFPNISDEKSLEILKDNLEQRFVYITHVDKMPKCIAVHRLEKIGLAYDLGKNVAAVELKNKYDHMFMDIGEFEYWSDNKNNLNNICPRDDRNNFNIVLNWQRLSEEEYEKLSKTLQSNELSKFNHHANGAYYTSVIRDLHIEVAKYVYGLDNVYFLIPKPEKFSTSKKDFENSIWCISNRCGNTFDFNKYDIIKCVNFNRCRAKDLLMANYELLKDGKYLSEYESISSWLIHNMHKEDEEGKARLKEAVEEMIMSGKSTEYIVEKVNCRVLPTIHAEDAREFNIEISKLYNNYPEAEYNSKKARLATFEGICDFLDISYPRSMINEENTETVEENTETVEEPDLDILVDIEIHDKYKSHIRLVRNIYKYVKLAFFEEVTSESIKIDGISIEYRDWINMNYETHIFEKYIDRFLRGRDSSYTCNEILEKLK